MPAKNSIKQYFKNGYYHFYNRGVDKRKIFQDEQDYKVFLSYLKDYLEPKNEDELRKAFEKASYKEKDRIAKKLLMNNFSDKIKLLAYCLMPNHFHLLVRQSVERGIESFMKSLATRYVIYFNRKHKRIGSLFQGVYKAVLVETEEQLLYLTRYIHLNPNEFTPYQGLTLLDYPYSSLGAYLGDWRAKWLKPQAILSFFSKKNKNLSYKSFVLDERDLKKSFRVIESLVLE